MFAENTTGEGHVTRTLEGVRTFAYLPVPDEFDITAWPLAEEDAQRSAGRRHP